MLPCRSPRRAAASLLFLALLAASAPAQGRKLNGPLPRPLGGDVVRHEVSADGTRVVYYADEETDGVYSLYSVRPGGAGTRVELASASELERISNWEISPLGRNVVVGVWNDSSLSRSLRVVPIDGGASREIAEGGHDFLVDAAERWIVYRVRAPATVRGYDLWVVPFAGGAPVQLNPQAGAYGVRTFDLSPDGRRVVFIADAPGGVFELYSAPIGGGSLVKLSPGFEVDSELLVLDPRGLRAVFTNKRLGGGDNRRLYSAPLRGARPAVELVADFVPSSYTTHVTSDGLRVVAVRSSGAGGELVSVPIAGGPTTVLHAEPTQSDFRELELTPDARFALFQLARSPSDQLLFSAPVDGSSPALELGRSFGQGIEVSPDSRRAVFNSTTGFASVLVDGSAPPVVLAGVGVYDQISPDGSRVVYLGSIDGTSAEDLFSVPIDGGAPATRINADLPFAGTVRSDFQLSASTRRVVYVASQSARDQFELYSAPIDGGFAPLRLNHAMPPGPVEGDVYRMEPTPDGRHVVYTADQDEDSVNELYSARSDGRGAPVQLNEDLEPGQRIFTFVLTPDSTRVVYRITPPVAAPTPILVAPVAGGPSLLLSTGLRAMGLDLHVDPTGTRAVFGAGPTATDWRLYAVPLDASAPPVELPGAVNPLRALFTSDGSRVVFSGDGASGAGVYSARLDGTGSAVRLDAIAGGTGATQQFELAATGGRVLFTNDPFAAGRYELFSAAVDGSAGPVRLNPALIATRRVVGFASASNGFAFYLADQDQLGRLEVYRAPLDGSAPATRVSATLVSGGSVWHFRVAPDGTRVLYVADQEVHEKYELYSVAGDGSGPVSKLNLPLGPDGDVGGVSEAVFELSPDGSRVAFTAGLISRGANRLYGARSDGSAPAVEIGGGPDYGDNGLAIEELAFVPDGSSVVYSSLHSYQLGYALYHAPIDRARRVRRVSGFGDGDPDHFRKPPFAISPDGGRVVFMNDQETRSVSELFASFLSLDFAIR